MWLLLDWRKGIRKRQRDVKAGNEGERIWANHILCTQTPQNVKSGERMRKGDKEGVKWSKLLFSCINLPYKTHYSVQPVLKLFLTEILSHAWNPSSGELRWENHRDLEASLVYVSELKAIPHRKLRPYLKTQTQIILKINRWLGQGM